MKSPIAYPYGLLDDYVLVRWVVDTIRADYSEFFEA